MSIALSWAWVWLLLAAGLIVGEIFTAGFFLLPFGLGAAVAAFVAWMGAPPTAQWITFLGVSLALMAPLRRFAERLTDVPQPPVAGERMLGRVGTVLETVQPHGITGRVRVGTEEWRASAAGEAAIAAGTEIEVLAVDGTHLVVRPRAASSADPATQGTDA